MDKKVKYKWGKPLNTAKKPMRIGAFWTWLIHFLSKHTMAADYEIERIGVEGLEPPYFLFSNHMHFVDFKLAAMATYPHKLYNVVHVDGYYMKPFVMDWIGCICTRKFTNDMDLLSSIDTVLKKHKGVLSMYPEARYSPIGTTAVLPDSLGMLVKKQGVPVVTIIHHGNHLFSPFWDFRHKRKVKLHTTMKLILTPEQIEEMSYAEINDVIRREMQYNEYDYLKESGQQINEPFRAEGLHKILYQCPRCLTESRMTSRGTRLICEECGKEWEFEPNGRLRALDGETEFNSPPEWFEWERSQVRAQIEAGEYSFEDEVEVYSLRHPIKFVNIGKAKLTHDPKNGFILSGNYNGEDYHIQRKPMGMYSLHVEYDHCFIKPYDCIDISTNDDSLFCYPTKQNVVTKLSFATEEIFKHHQEKRAERKRARLEERKETQHADQ